MTTWYSDHYSSGVAQSAKPDPFVAIKSSKRHSRMRVSRAEVDLTAQATADGDIIRLMTLKSNDRIYSIKNASDGGATALTTWDLGVYATGDDNDGAVLDINMFGAALDEDTGYAMTERILTDANINDEDIGMELWELVNLGAATTYSADPVINMDLCVTILNGLALGSRNTTIVEYTSGA
jgi:hypothetical protein